jgi:hypothetical protein
LYSSENIIAHDFNSDGYVDLAVKKNISDWQAEFAGGLAIYYNDGGTGFQEDYFYLPQGDIPSPAPTKVYCGNLSATDVDNDGDAELFNGCYVETYNIYENPPELTDQVIYLRYFENEGDAAPAPPQNIAMSTQSGHPHITWTANKEADLQEYEVWKMKTDTYNWALRATSTNTYYTDTAEDVDARGDYTAYYKLKAVDAADNKSEFSSTVSIRVENGLGLGKQIVQVSDEIPQSFVLLNNYPNPFNPVTTIPFDLPEANFTSLSIYNSLGQKVATLVNRELEAGRYQAEFDAGSLPSGVYFYRLTAGKFTAVKRMLLIK